MNFIFPEKNCYIRMLVWVRSSPLSIDILGWILLMKVLLRIKQKGLHRLLTPLHFFRNVIP